MNITVFKVLPFLFVSLPLLLFLHTRIWRFGSICGLNVCLFCVCQRWVCCRHVLGNFRNKEGLGFSILYMILQVFTAHDFCGFCVVLWKWGHLYIYRFVVVYPLCDSLDKELSCPLLFFASIVTIWLGSYRAVGMHKVPVSNHNQKSPAKCHTAYFGKHHSVVL